MSSKKKTKKTNMLQSAAFNKGLAGGPIMAILNYWSNDYLMSGVLPKVPIVGALVKASNELTDKMYSIKKKTKKKDKKKTTKKKR